MKHLNLFIELTRLNKPIGYMLLFWPCFWGLTLSYDFNNEIYTYSGLILNEFVEYSFLPEEPLNLDNINIFLSYLSGIKIEVGEVIIFTEKNQINKKPNNLLFSSNSSFIDYEKDENISLLIMKEGDEIININFGEKFENVNKIILKMKIRKLDLVNQKNCQLNGLGGNKKKKIGTLIGKIIFNH